MNLTLIGSKPQKPLDFPYKVLIAYIQYLLHCIHYMLRNMLAALINLWSTFILIHTYSLIEISKPYCRITSDQPLSINSILFF